MSFLWLQSGQIWSRRLRANINNTLRAFLSLVAEFLSSIFSLPTIFPFHLISPARFLGCSLHLLSRFLFIAHTAPCSDFCRIYGHTLPCSPSYNSRSTVVIYIFFAFRPLMYRRFIGLSIMNSIRNKCAIYLYLICYLFIIFEINDFLY